MNEDHRPIVFFDNEGIEWTLVAQGVEIETAHTLERFATPDDLRGVGYVKTEAEPFEEANETVRLRRALVSANGLIRDQAERIRVLTTK